ncbi:MAG: ATP-grasp domain-containing protein [Parachlamydiaceae bacterium]|nr:ATP-grasp domain-containing protein [Parachlamydiaceae bacterium]
MVKSEKLRIGVLMGGISAEREVSFNSGRTVFDHLDTTHYDVVPLFQTDDGLIYKLPWHFLHRGKSTDFSHRLPHESQQIPWDALKGTVDFIYSTLHGFRSEDGVLQGALELLGIPYLGSKILGSAVGMDKAFAKKVFSQHGIKTPKGVVLTRQQIASRSIPSIVAELEEAGIALPYIVKPVNEGSSLGVSCVETIEQLVPALSKALVSNSASASVLIEEKIIGMEFVATLIQKNDLSWAVLPITEIVPEEGTRFFDYEQKYMPGRAKKITPARCSEADLEIINANCSLATQALNFSTISRVDGFLTAQGEVVIIDTQPFPNMAPTSFVFQQAALSGMTHTQLINYLIDHELKRSGYDLTTHFDEGLLMDKSTEKKMRLAVILGGTSNEREISLESGRNICYKLSPRKYEVTPLFLWEESKLYELTPELLIQNKTETIAEGLTPSMVVLWSTLPSRFDFIFIGLHGGKGENGSVQGMLEMLNMPYNGSGVLSSSLCMNKFKTNEFLAAQGFDVPASALVSRSEWQSYNKKEEKLLRCSSISSELGFPLILKPHDDGCSVMVKKIKNPTELLQELEHFFSGPKDISMLEAFVPGIELTCGVIGNESPQALPPSMVVTKADILSIEEKFLPGEGENQTPALIPASALKLTQETVEKAFQALGCKGYARIDCFYQNKEHSPTGNERIVILEVNTLPGMTPATCIFHQAAEIGLRPMEFIDRIVSLGLENHASVPSELIH